MKIGEKNSKKTEYVIIIGCGRLGSSVANKLSRERKSIVVIDEDSNSFARLSEDFSGFTITGNGADLDVLKNANIERADTLLATTQSEAVNLMVAQIAKRVFNVDKVVAKINSIEFAKVFGKYDIETICPNELSSTAFSHILENGGKR